MDEKPQRSWLQFKVRTLMVVVALLSIPLGWLSRERIQSGYEKQVADELVAKGFKTALLGDPYYPIESKTWKKWRDPLRRAVGDRVVQVCEPPAEFEDVTLLAGLTNLQWLVLNGSQVRDISSLAQLSSLSRLHLKSTRVASVDSLKTLDNLEHLDISGTQVWDLTPLHGLRSLKWLNVVSSSVTIDQIEALQEALPDCKILHDKAMAR